MQEAVNSAYNIALFYLIIYYLFIVYRKDIIMKKIALYFTNQIIKIDNEAEADREIYLYAFESIFTKIFIYILLCIIGIATKTFFSVGLTIVYIVLLRGQTSGFHANTPYVCTLLSITTCLGCVFISLNVVFSKNHYMILFLLIISVLYILHTSPINHKALDLTPYEKEIMHKKTGRILFIELLFISLFYISSSLRSFSLCGSLSIIAVAFYMLLAKLLNQEVKNE